MSAAGSTELDEKLARLDRILRSMGRVLVGYSGGVDSALLAVAARRALGENAIAVTADSPSYAGGELEAAGALARRFGLRHEVVRTAELQNPDYARNPANRCYFCKQELFVHMQRLARKLGVSHILYGQNADDEGEFRPGARAARESGARAPLQEAGLTKEEIREAARRWKIPVWNRPAMACLSSRFPYGTPISAAALRQVDRAESYLRDCGFSQLRARHHGDLARIELCATELPRLLLDPQLRAGIARVFAGLGYSRTTADLRGFRSGSMNEVLAPAVPPGGETHPGIEECTTELGLGRARFETRARMLCLRLEESAFARLETLRCALVERLEKLGFRYIALDLVPLQ